MNTYMLNVLCIGKSSQNFGETASGQNSNTSADPRTAASGRVSKSQTQVCDVTTNHHKHHKYWFVLCGGFRFEITNLVCDYALIFKISKKSRTSACHLKII